MMVPARVLTVATMMIGWSPASATDRHLVVEVYIIVSRCIARRSAERDRQRTAINVGPEAIVGVVPIVADLVRRCVEGKRAQHRLHAHSKKRLEAARRQSGAPVAARAVGVMMSHRGPRHRCVLR